MTVRARLSREAWNRKMKGDWKFTPMNEGDRAE